MTKYGGLKSFFGQEMGSIFQLVSTRTLFLLAIILTEYGGFKMFFRQQTCVGKVVIFQPRNCISQVPIITKYFKLFFG